MKDLEVELQLKVESTDKLISFLEKNGNFQGNKHQIDEYFVPAHRNFLGKRPINEWLRLRNSDGTYLITYKNWHIPEDGQSFYCDEYETTLGSIEILKKIFSALNMRSVCTVDKTRRVWHIDEYEISIDTISGLGEFVEIEYKGEGTKSDLSRIRQAMLSFLKNHDCGKMQTNSNGYPFMLMFPDEVTFTTV